MPADITTLPAPPVLASLDLRGFPYMGLDVVRLRDSDLASAGDFEAFQAAVLLWCVAWHQVPAGSLPDNDKLLARYIGYGRDVARWRKVREAALRGFTLCSDGRLYHAVVCEKAVVADGKRTAQRARTEAARLAKLEKQVKSTKVPSVTETVTVPVTATVTEPVTASKGREGKGREGKEENQNQNTPTSSLAAGARAFDEGKVSEEASKAAIKLPPKVVEHVPPENHARQAEFGKLAQEIVSAFKERGVNPDFPPDTNQVWVWENQGYRASVILAAIKHALANSHKARATTNLRWFDNAIAEAHATAQALGKLPSTAGRTPAEQDAAWRRRIANYRTDVSSWVAAYGPRPGNSGCKVPIPLLVEHGYPISTDKPVLVHTQRSATA